MKKKTECCEIFYFAIKCFFLFLNVMSFFGVVLFHSLCHCLHFIIFSACAKCAILTFFFDMITIVDNGCENPAVCETLPLHLFHLKQIKRLDKKLG